MLGDRHGVSPEIGEIAANEDGGEESEEGKSESEEEMKDEEDEENVKGESEEGQDSIGICKPCRPNIAEVEIHGRTHLPFGNWCEINQIGMQGKRMQ